MGWLDWITGGTASRRPPALPTASGRRGLTTAERRANRQRQLQDLQERIDLERARAEVRALRSRGRPRAQATPTSPIASVRETVEEALDLADALRGQARDTHREPVAPDAPAWERLLNSQAGVRLAESVAPAIAPMLAGMLAQTTTAPALPANTQANTPTRPEAVPNPEEEQVAANLIAAVVGFADRSPEQAAAAVLEAARTQAASGRTELLAVVTQAARTPATLVRLVAGRYRADETHGATVARILDTPGYLDTLLRSLKGLLATGDSDGTARGAGF